MKKGVDFIGVTCVFYCHDGKGNFLMHKRNKNCRDEIGRWDCGGGSLEFGETPEQAVKREIKEEYCADVIEIQFLRVNNVIRERKHEKTHWIALVFAVQINPKQVKIGDPNKMDGIGWFKPGNWPKPLHSMFLEHFDYVKEKIYGANKLA